MGNKHAQTLDDNVTPRCLGRVKAAQYVGIGETLFDRGVREGWMPQPKQAGGRRIWDIRALDRAVDALAETEAANSWTGIG